jgi:hypothetical protein
MESNVIRTIPYDVTLQWASSRSALLFSVFDLAPRHHTSTQNFFTIGQKRSSESVSKTDIISAIAKISYFQREL